VTHAPFIPYQTEEDKKRQKDMISTLSFIWNFTPQDQGEFAVIDYKCYRSKKLVGLLEIKSKFCKVSDYSTYICTTKDIDVGLKMSIDLGVPFVLSVKWNDFWGYLKVTTNKYPSRKSGQMNRNDPNDYMTMCYLIPISEFKEIRAYD
jgi:hypothetical protein